MGGALARLRRPLKPGGRLAVLVQGPPERSPADGLLLETLRRATEAAGGIPETGQDAETVALRLAATGLAHTGSHSVTRTLRRADFDGYWSDLLADRLPGA